MKVIVTVKDRYTGKDVTREYEANKFESGSSFIFINTIEGEEYSFPHSRIKRVVIKEV